MTLLVISPDYASHLYPLATLATAWRDAGERVVVATGPATDALVKGFGLERVDLRLGRGSNPGVIRAETLATSYSVEEHTTGTGIPLGGGEQQLGHDVGHLGLVLPRSHAFRLFRAAALCFLLEFVQQSHVGTRSGHGGSQGNASAGAGASRIPSGS